MTQITLLLTQIALLPTQIALLLTRIALLPIQIALLLTRIALLLTRIALLLTQIALLLTQIALLLTQIALLPTRIALLPITITFLFAKSHNERVQKPKIQPLSRLRRSHIFINPNLLPHHSPIISETIAALCKQSGMPPPGCTLPPTKNKFGYKRLKLGCRRNADILSLELVP